MRRPRTSFGERALHGASDRHGSVFGGSRSRSGVVEGDAGAVETTAVHVEAASVKDVGAGPEGHVGAAPGRTLNVDAAAVNPGREGVRTAVVDLATGIAATSVVDGAIDRVTGQREPRSGHPGERIRLPRNIALRRRGEAGTVPPRGPGDSDRCGGHAGASAVVQRVVVARIAGDPAVGVYGKAAVHVDRLGDGWVLREDTEVRTLDPRNRSRAHRRALETEDGHEYRGAGLGNDGFHEVVLVRPVRIEAADRRVMDGDLRIVHPVFEAVRLGRFQPRRLDVRVAHRIS